MSVTGIAANNAFVPINVEQDLDPPSLQLVDPTRGEPLHDLFSRIVQEGRKDEAVAIVRDISAEVTGIEILTESGEPRLFLTTKHGAAPASLGGDGVQALLRTVFELAGSSGGTVLLEEPEVHLHPRALHQVALAILAAVRRNRQVILTTHSQELIESLVALMSEEEIGDPQFLTVVRTRLTKGMFSSVSIRGSEVRSAFVELSEDLR